MTREWTVIDTSHTDAQLLDAAERQLARLDRHLRSLESGELDAVEDVSVVLRTLLCRGRGDDLIARVRRRIGASELLIQTGPSMTRTSDIRFGFASLPVSQDPAAESYPSMTIRSWLQETALHFDTGSRTRWTWERLINEYGNNWGAHVGTALPAFFVEAQVHQAGSHRLDIYLLRAAGYAARTALRKTLQRAGRLVPDDPIMRHLNRLYSFAFGELSMELTLRLGPREQLDQTFALRAGPDRILTLRPGGVGRCLVHVKSGELSRYYDCRNWEGKLLGPFDDWPSY